MTFDDVAALVSGLPGVTVATKWGNHTWLVGGKFFAWRRGFSKADLERFGDETPPAGEILAVRVESLDAKDALLAMAPKGFFTIPHFNGYPAVLIALRQARAKDVRAVLLDAHAAAIAAAARPKRRVTAAGSRRRSTPRSRSSAGGAAGADVVDREPEAHRAERVEPAAPRRRRPRPGPR
jgi:hypothetical protein